MISKEEIKKLADLARIDVSDEEIESLRSEMDSILDYVGQVSDVVGKAGLPSPEQGLPAMTTRQAVEGGRRPGGVLNVFREDQNPTESGTYSKDLISEFPEAQDNYLKVKKIL